MAQSMTSGALSQRASGVSAQERVYCKECGSEKLHRMFRRGFMQEKVYPLFGYFPWRCMHCGRRVMLRRRYRMKSDLKEE